jgi:hypothetical protein
MGPHPYQFFRVDPLLVEGQTRLRAERVPPLRLLAEADARQREAEVVVVAVGAAGTGNGRSHRRTQASCATINQYICGEPLWLSGKVVKNEKINEIERTRVCSPTRATS